MDQVQFEKLDLNNAKRKIQVTDFLNQFDLNYTDVDTTIIATIENEIVGVCSKLNNLIKNIAIGEEYSGMNLTNSLITMMVKEIFTNGYDNAFVITKFINKQIFTSLNFKKIYENDVIVFLALKNQTYLDYKKNDPKFRV
ncbi:hypothetical protein SCLARK_001804 [Spiroplasma clarkii]|uniref:hypothetical protein n=1 Tax=Spiroplasma clarkii TaxID=2139 RepID=UPI000B5770CC|nr:hypothetical protein [Spiroplasma clarkii]ARU92249.1 hypothetical protein SCLARK_001804 [Spiroplasma clarkii]